MEIENKIPDTFENVLFTNISEQLVGNAKPSELIPLIEYVASEWDLDIRLNKNFKTAVKIIKHQAQWN